ncbi:hypothetical protein PHLCEN_2v7324 [Hermanssonia centrifuga]|uniref:Uncharacterized protein n=1 Tax=Hermanssonia centrifuga TaxID=98765 RepID=A0A2R6NXB8_9APHY|nr:hypothetical protein PHLCEN_2v7324 [Hermanssonia centrifuga]
MSDPTSITDTRHNDYVGNDANIGRIPGAEKATTGHHYVSVFPKGEPQPQPRSISTSQMLSPEGPPPKHGNDGALRPEEHLPAPTGRDRPPRGINEAIHTSSSDHQGHISDRISNARNREPAPQFHHAVPKPLSPAPGSRTVIDRDPMASPATAGETLGGATSQDVYDTYGAPGGGQTSTELHHDGNSKRKRNLQGTDQYGTAEDVAKRDNDVDLSGWKEGL